ncbi:MAG: epoxyqueuosine reductase [bacterium]|nr:epoxyqueuosine reductase [bacterium]
MNLESKIKKLVENKVEELGRPDLFRAPLVAFSSVDDERFLELKQLIGDWHLTPKELLPEAKSVISYFVPFTKEVVMNPKKMKDGSALWSEAYQEINAYFDVINEAIKSYLESEGYLVMTIKSTHTYDPKDLKATWSHRSAAVIAGLATLGANRLAITEKGSGGRFCTVITSAELEPNPAPIEEKCMYKKNGSCGLCFKACPIGALKSDGLDKFACQDELNKNQDLLRKETTLVDADTCGKCISACPLAYID